MPQIAATTDAAAPKAPLSRTALIRILTSVQNTGTFWDRDIMTIAGLSDDVEIGEHIVRCFHRLTGPEKTFVFENLISDAEVRS